jgi:hypothetical protein
VLYCDDSLLLVDETSLFSNEFGNFILAEYAKQLTLGTKSAENP